MARLFFVLMLMLVAVTGNGQIFTEYDLNSKGWISAGEFVEIGSKVYFSCATVGDTNSGIWVSDGTVAGTKVVSKAAIGGNLFEYRLTPLNNQLVFVAQPEPDDQVQGIELWTSDGSTAGTVLLKDIRPGGNSSFPQHLTLFQNMVVFSADDGVHGEELWKTDGTEAGTVLIKDIQAGGGPSTPRFFTPLGAHFLFTANVTGAGAELWISDGTEAGTQLLKDLRPAAGASSFPQTLFAYEDKIYFTADSGGIGAELWVTDGTAAGTIFLRDIGPGSDGAGIREFTGSGGKVFFAANDGIHGEELWVSDGTPEGTTLVKDIYSGPDASYPQSYTNYNGKLYFSASDGANGYELWTSDGTEAGTVLAVDLQPGSTSASPFSLTVLEDSLYFVADLSAGERQLFVSDGTPSGTHPLVPVFNPVGFVKDFYPVYEALGALWIHADYDLSEQDLWSYTPGSSGVDIDADLLPAYFKVFPNPAEDNLFIINDATRMQPFTATLFELQGRKLPVSGTSLTELRLDVSGLPAGLYLLKLESGAGVYWARIKVQ